MGYFSMGYVEGTGPEVGQACRCCGHGRGDTGGESFVRGKFCGGNFAFQKDGGMLGLCPLKGPLVCRGVLLCNRDAAGATLLS